MLFRTILSCMMVISMMWTTACNRKQDKQGTGDGVSLDQDVTREPKPKDIIFVDFQNNWKQFISQRPELALPVIPITKEGQPAPTPAPEAVQPLINSRCVFSADAGGFVPQVTIMWNEAPPTVPVPGRIALAKQEQPELQQAPDQSKLRFDLAIHFQGFEKNQFTSTIASDTQKRFNLPSNSNFISNSDALLLTGPSLFPKVMDFRVERVMDRDTNREIPKSTLVVRDLGPGLSYKLRTSTLGQNQWNENRQIVFTTPICPKDF